MYVDLAGFVTTITGNIRAKDIHLPISDDDYDYLLEHLSDGDYTFLEIRDGKASEYVKVSNICGKIAITRGAEKTKPTAFRCGTALSFVLTMQGVKDTVCQMGDCNDL